ncbi:hypothetical protein MAA_07410 [Metarhizium robertsii ARSEF 23]|uniref:Uncharacterized protein n=1 Tax=Metarhizium robertsii (strain ARSEF 23 / ATCC MYA-3075) TaxID=655844 RepID=E9F561_METRA|nr:uncharacterized protein MAA_07410 [Metarhizium robertsii ARSEF 23]EFY97114.2 hypothetical protein MAA_07410 [Metarhizium robertsii ARSEF 23]
MFGGSRRRQPPAQPLTRETANPNAATAAAAVFMSRRDSTSSLSSAAAAAALRARPMTPTNVAEVQSKRAHRRSPSLTSLTGSVRGGRELTRTPSVGSMMERTFRTPSPGRSPAPRERDVPPVPALPSVDQIMASHHTNGHTKGTRGPVLQTQPFRTASQKMKDGQATWFGGATARESASPRHANTAIQSATYVHDPRPGSVSPSINFSYPRSRALSPTPSIDDTLVYDPNSRRMIPQSEVVARSQRPLEVPEKPKRKKQSVNRAGSHLAKGTVGGRTKAPAVEQNLQLETQHEPQAEQEPEPAPVVLPETAAQQSQDGAVKKRKKKKKRVQAASEPKVASTTKELPVDEAEPVVSRPAPGKKRSVVNEDFEREDTKQQGDEQGQMDSAAAAAAAVVAVPTAETEAQTKPEPRDTKPDKQVRPARVHSESPARSARFASSSTDQLVVKHEPPPRSVSPRKSAMKLSTQARGVSPSDDGSSEASSSRQLSPQDSEDPALARKKSARVSWDDRNTVVVGQGVAHQQSGSPMIPSPQTKKPWHNVVSKFTKKESVSIAEDETMTPRPALPQFGSIREKKVREKEERPLVRPSDRMFPTENGSAAAGIGPSTDTLIGSIVSLDLASRNAANISKFREPLPAAPNSPEANQDGHVESSDDDLDTDATTEPEDAPESTTSKGSGHVVSETPVTPTKPIPTQSDANGGVPAISVSHPSPRAQSSGEATPPGSFPDDEDTFGDNSDDEESDSSGMSTPTRTVAPVVVATGMADIVEEEEETENDRFSDAYEDLEAVDGDGFLSLDAVVDSSTSGKVIAKKVQDKPIVTKSKDSLEGEREVSTPVKEVPDDWENAKAYWRSLSTERRRQLEIEALSETGEAASAIKEPKPEAKEQAEKVTAPSLGMDDERSYQIKPGTRWSDVADDGDDEHGINVAKRASAVATQPKTAENTTPKLRTAMRQSMRADAPGPLQNASPERPGGMRKSMRNGHPPAKTTVSRQAAADGTVARSNPAATPSTVSTVGMRKSLRNSQTYGDTLRPALSGSGRPASYQQLGTTTSLKGHKRNMSLDDLSSTSATKPTLRRRGSNDSQSSFKRKRSGSGDGHNFRMSMRASMREQPSPSDPTRRFSLRSLSPPAFRRNSFSSLPPGTPPSMSGGAGRMRQSLRGRPQSSSSRLKMGSFKKSSGLGSKSRSGSRFADSSDEDEGGAPSFFRSRFADSSEEDEPTPLPKSKDLPKSLRNGNGSNVVPSQRDSVSPDLPDEDEGIVQPKRDTLANGQPSVHQSRSGRGTLSPLPQNDMPRPTTRRGSFMSILRRKKDPADKISKDLGESAARKDTNLERTTEELAVLRSNSLHKRGPSWPLADAGGTDAENGRLKEPARPSTSGGPSKARKSSFLRRRSTSQGMVGLGHPEVDNTVPVPEIPDMFITTEPAEAQPHKKKKFGALRKMFGIHD